MTSRVAISLRSLSQLPLTVEPEAADGAVDLIAWIGRHRERLDAALLEHGAVLFRRFGVLGADQFQAFVGAAAPELMDYVDGNSPRTRVAGGMYTSTEYPAKYEISMHNELSYSARWPSRLFFFCDTPAESGGETPVASSAAILRALDPAVAAEFERKGVRYIRNLHGGWGAGPSWQDTYETRDRSVVEARCRDGQIDLEWRSDGSLRLTQTRPATIAHPITGTRVWFNQADQFHPSTLPPDVRRKLEIAYAPDELPQYATFGDGTPLGEDALEHVRATARAHANIFPWRRGDVLVVDNVLVCHGRRPFIGPRRILVSMAC